jgi:integrase
VSFDANLPRSPAPSNVVPLKRGKPAIDEPATASETQASVRATDDTFDPFVPLTWPKGMWAFLRSNVPSNADAAEAYQTWRQLQIEDERNVLLRSIVEAKLAPAAPSIRGVGAVFGEPVTVRDYVLKRWIPSRARLANVKDDERDLVNHVLPIIGDEDMRTIQREPLASIRNTFNARSELPRSDPRFFAAKSGRKVWGLVAKMFGDASDEDAGGSDPLDPTSLPLHVRDDDPTAKIKSPIMRDERLQSVLWPVEFDKLSACARVPLHWLVLYIVALFTGLRQSELRHLRVCDVDLVNGLLTVANSISRKTGKPGKTKTKAKGRALIEANLRPLLAALCEGRDGAERLLWMPAPEDLAEFTRKHLLQAEVDRTELHVPVDDETYQRFVFHGWRHTHLTWRAGRGDNPTDLMGTVLHTDFTTTLGYIDQAVLHVLRRQKDTLFAPLPAWLIEAARGGSSPERTSALSRGTKGGSGGGAGGAGGTTIVHGGADTDAPGTQNTVQFPLGSQYSRVRPGG